MSPRESCLLYQHSVCIELTHKHLEMHRCIPSTMSTDALVLKCQVISIHSADQICTAFDQSLKTITFIMTTLENKINFGKKIPSSLRVKWFPVQIPRLPECHFDWEQSIMVFTMQMIAPMDLVCDCLDYGLMLLVSYVCTCYWYVQYIPLNMH